MLLSLVASGSVSDFSDSEKLLLQQGIALAAGVESSFVFVEVAAGSVQITASIFFPASMNASEVHASLSSNLGNSSAATEALNITVIGVPEIVPIANGVTAQGNDPVAVIPIQPGGSNSARRLSEAKTKALRSTPSFTWTEGCPRSQFMCEDASRQWVDLSAYHEFSMLLGHGYSEAFGDCVGGMMPATPYSLSHAGGIFPEKYDDLLPFMRKNIDRYIDSVKAGSFDGMIHNGAYHTSCGANGYLAEDHYTCGLQYIQMAATFPGESCKKLRDGKLIEPSGDDGGFRDAFNASGNLSTRYTEVKQECTSTMGGLAMFDAIKRFYTEGGGTTDGFIKFQVNVTLPKEPDPGAKWEGNGDPYLERFMYLLEQDNVGVGEGWLPNGNITDKCRYEVVVAMGTPGCNAPVTTIEDAKFVVNEDNGRNPENVSKYALSDHGFEYSAANNLWHREGVTGCELGCCDDCFQWFCPTHKHFKTPGNEGLISLLRDGTNSAPFTCRPYNYTCAEESPYATSDDMQCGIPTNVSWYGVQYENRSRC